MNVSSFELDIVFSSNSSGINYLGDFPIDSIPPVDSFYSGPTSCIVNCDVASEPGSHWFALAIIPKNREVLFIEPMGLEKLLLRSLKPLDQWCKRALHRVGGGRLSMLPFAIQPRQSTLCGAYCAYIISRLHLYNFDLKSLTEREFLRQAAAAAGNDQRVAAWWYKRHEANA